MRVMNAISIRRYEPKDRAAVRELCCDTGDKGAPCNQFFPDRKLFADMWASYYTDFESQHCWVAEHEGKVIGYLLSCFNNVAFRWIQFGWILPIAFLKALLRGSLISKRMQLLIWRNIFSPKIGRAKKFGPMNGLRGHLHINMDQKFRGQKVGDKLIQICLDEAQKSGLQWMTAGVRADNNGSQKFFQRLGFKKMAEHIGFVIPGRSGYRIFIFEFGYSLSK